MFGSWGAECRERFEGLRGTVGDDAEGERCERTGDAGRLPLPALRPVRDVTSLGWFENDVLRPPLEPVSVGITGKFCAARVGDGALDEDDSSGYVIPFVAPFISGMSGGDGASSSSSSMDGNVCENSARLKADARGEEDEDEVGEGGPSVDGETKVCCDELEAVDTIGGAASCVWIGGGWGGCCCVATLEVEVDVDASADVVPKERSVGDMSDASECIESRLEGLVGEIGMFVGALGRSREMRLPVLMLMPAFWSARIRSAMLPPEVTSGPSPDSSAAWTPFVLR